MDEGTYHTRPNDNSHNNNQKQREVIEFNFSRDIERGQHACRYCNKIFVDLSASNRHKVNMRETRATNAGIVVTDSKKYSTNDSTKENVMHDIQLENGKYTLFERVFSFFWHIFLRI